jgi:hypothetical protein
MMKTGAFFVNAGSSYSAGTTLSSSIIMIKIVIIIGGWGVALVYYG